MVVFLRLFDASSNALQLGGRWKNGASSSERVEYGVSGIDGSSKKIKVKVDGFGSRMNGSSWIINSNNVCIHGSNWSPSFIGIEDSFVCSTRSIISVRK